MSKRLTANLLNIAAQLDEHQMLDQESQELLSRTAQRIIQPGSKRSRLTTDHVKIIAKLFEKTVNSSRRIEPLSLLSEVYCGVGEAITKLHFVIDLIELRILEPDRKKYVRIKREDSLVTFKLDPSMLIDVYIGFSEKFISFLMNGRRRYFNSNPGRFRSNREYVEAWFDYVETLCRCRHAYSAAEIAANDESDAIAKWEEIEARREASPITFPLSQVASRYDLSHDEQVVLMYILNESVGGRSATQHELMILLRHTKYDKFSKPLIILPGGKLISEGLVLFAEDNNLMLGHGEYEIAPDIGAEILGSRPHSATAVIEDVIGSDGVLEMTPPRKKLSQMVLPPETLKVVKTAVSRFNRDSYRTLAQWGFQDNVSVNASDTELGRLVMLLHGLPGTGKTALAHAIAGSLKRPLLTTDISRILDKWVGESEKRLKRLFMSYRKALKRAGKAPVLLLNEADQLISKRGAISQTTDRMYNQMQNILLENLETFSGILIATTNLIDNIDDAFSRRFDVKLKLDMPDQLERKKLWQILTPSKLPLADDIDFESLAEQYTFSGGQIEVVLRNAAVAAADRDGQNRIVRQSDLVKYAELESEGAFDSSNRKVIGFQATQ